MANGYFTNLLTVSIQNGIRDFSFRKFRYATLFDSYITKLPPGSQVFTYIVMNVANFGILYETKIVDCIR